MSSRVGVKRTGCRSGAIGVCVCVKEGEDLRLIYFARPCDRTTYISRARFDTRNAADAIRHAAAQTETIHNTAMVRVYRRRRKDSATPPAEFIVLFSGIYI